MNHNIVRQITIRIGVLAALFLFLTAGVYLIGLPMPWAWAAMLTMLAWTSIIRNIV